MRQMDEIETLKAERAALDSHIRELQAARSMPGWMAFLQERLGGEIEDEHLRVDGDGGLGLFASGQVVMLSVDSTERGIEILEAGIELIRARIIGQEV